MSVVVTLEAVYPGQVEVWAWTDQAAKATAVSHSNDILYTVRVHLIRESFANGDLPGFYLRSDELFSKGFTGHWYTTGLPCHKVMPAECLDVE
jgi:hypothetical protein